MEEWKLLRSLMRNNKFKIIIAVETINKVLVYSFHVFIYMFSVLQKTGIFKLKK